MKHPRVMRFNFIGFMTLVNPEGQQPLRAALTRRKREANLNSPGPADVHGPLRHVGDELEDQILQGVNRFGERVGIVAVSEKLKRRLPLVHYARDIEDKG